MRELRDCPSRRTKLRGDRNLKLCVQHSSVVLYGVVGRRMCRIYVQYMQLYMWYARHTIVLAFVYVRLLRCL